MRRTALVPLVAAVSCAGVPRFAPGTKAVPGERAGDEIVVCGERFHTGTPVVLWDDPGGYDAYSTGLHFPDEAPARPPAGLRYGGRRPDPGPQGWTLSALRDRVDQFVIHYDVAGTSRQCFKILQDRRGLSVHFLLDVDGTIYQTLDLKERAWHATKANDRSVGVEIAQIGAYPRPDDPVLEEWYGEDGRGPYVEFPPRVGPTGIRTRGFVARPARPALVAGRVQGKDLWQYDFTDEQYHALARLVATLARVLPRIRLDYPRDAGGRVAAKVLSPAAFDAFSGLLGHYHVQANKTDPGPAFDWDRLLREAQTALLSEGTEGP